ncbi:MAG: SCO family protein [Anaerolineae bacterium]|nr:SCO family protein [Anaerolineae bacterium]
MSRRNKKFNFLPGRPAARLRPKILIVVLAAIFLSGITPLYAQEQLPQDLIKKVGFEQKLETQLPLNLQFTDSTGRAVRLDDYFDNKPVILAMGYYECPMLCSLIRNGLFESLQKLEYFTVGRDFEVVYVSIDPAETPEIAETKRRVSVMAYGRSTTGEGWNFLVGNEEPIKTLADAIGFKYTYDANIDEYVHPSGIIVVTPEGRISKYLYGIEFPALDLRLALVEAAENKIGTPVDQFLLTCYHYDPVEGQYTLFVTNIVRMAGGATVVVFGLILGWLLYRERRKGVAVNSST